MKKEGRVMKTLKNQYLTDVAGGIEFLLDVKNLAFQVRVIIDSV